MPKGGRSPSPEMEITVVLFQSGSVAELVSSAGPLTRRTWVRIPPGPLQFAPLLPLSSARSLLMDRSALAPASALPFVGLAKQASSSSRLRPLAFVMRHGSSIPKNRTQPLDAPKLTSYTSFTMGIQQTLAAPSQLQLSLSSLPLLLLADSYPRPRRPVQ